MGKMAVGELPNSISTIGLKDITLREGRWRVEFDDSEQSEFFCNMVDGKVKFKGTILKVRPWIFSYGVEQIWDQLETYANLERQKSQDAQGLGGKISAVGEEGCAVCLSLGKEGRAATHLTADHRLAPSYLKTIQSKMDGKGNPPKNYQQDGSRDADQHGRGKGKGQPKGTNRDWTPKDYSQQGGDPSGSRWTKAGGKSGGKSGEKGGKGQGKSGNQDDSKVNGNLLYTETPANKTFPATRILEVVARADPMNSTPIPTPPTTKAKEVRKVVVGNHLVVVDVEKESMPLRQEKNGLTEDRYKTCSQTAKKKGSREANLTQPPTLVLSGRKQSPSA